jgi:hypothetical protein
MKKGLILIATVIIAVVIYFYFFNKKDNGPAAPKQQPLAQSKNSDAFNKPFNDFLNGYFDLKNALVNWDSAQAGATAKNLISLASKVPYDSLKADTTIILTAKNFSDNVVAEAQGLQQDPSLLEKRHSFYTLSENLYNLLRTVHYDQQIIYHDKCPMAFGDSDEGWWVSNTREIVNPYFGNKHPKYHSGMVTCGSVEDSVDFVKK